MPNPTARDAIADLSCRADVNRTVAILSFIGLTSLNPLHGAFIDRHAASIGAMTLGSSQPAGSAVQSQEVAWNVELVERTLDRIERTIAGIFSRMGYAYSAFGAVSFGLLVGWLCHLVVTDPAT